MVQAWTGHSERATLASALATVGVGKEERDYLGRWAPQASDGYVRTYRALVRKLVWKFTEEVKTGHAFKSFEEEDTYLGVLSAMMAKGAIPESKDLAQG